VHHIGSSKSITNFEQFDVYQCARLFQLVEG
jgi:hypothetical protein